MDSLDILNLRIGECSFLETVLADIRHYIKTFDLEQTERQVVLVFPPFNSRNRFLVHTLVQNFFNDLKTVSIGNSYGRRTVVHHSSLKPMLCEMEFDKSMEIHDGDKMHRPYRTPSERKAQQKLFQSLVPQKKVDEISRSTQRKQNKRPDIPIYVPKALRGLANNTDHNRNNTSKTSNLTSSNKPINNFKISDHFNNILYSQRTKSSKSLSNNINKQTNNCVLTSLSSFKFVDLSNEMNVDEFQTPYNNDSLQISNSLSSRNISDYLNTNGSNSNLFSETNDNTESLTLNNVGCKSNNVGIICNTVCDNTNNQNNTRVHSPDIQTSVINNKVSFDDILEFKKNKSNEITLNEKNLGMSNKKQHEILQSNTRELDLAKEHDRNCPNYCLDDSFTSGPLTDIEEKVTSSTDEELNTQPSFIFDSSISLNIVKNIEMKKAGKKKKKKVIDVDECSWEDLYDKEDDYIHPLLMKELVSTMGKVQVQCAKEDYRSHQTIEERSGDGECVIEVYGFSPDLKTVDLMNQFAAFRKNHFEIVWVNDTHALAVFESPNLADRALNTSFALVKTRPLKNAIKESKLKAETIAPLPSIRPKTCTSMARRLVSSALGLKMNVSPEILSAERTILENAKEKKIRDIQLRDNIWNNES